MFIHISTNAQTHCRYHQIQMNKCDPPDYNVPFYTSIKQLPTTTYLELTPVCNNRCPGCANDGFIANFDTRELKLSINHRTLTGEEWDLILDKLGPSVTFINLTGGEPTLHPNFDAIATSINRRGIDFVIFSNARWHKSEHLIRFLTSLPHFKGFLISLHGATAETHETFTGVSGSFQETLANISLAVRAGLAVSTSTVITHQNVPELAKIAALSRELGAQEAVFNRYLVPPSRLEQPVGDSMLVDMVPTRNDLLTAVRIIESLRQQTVELHQIDYGPCIPQCFTPSSSRGCSAGETFLVIDPWGNVKPCTDTDLHCGNLLTQTLEDVWWSKAMQSWRELIPSGCSSCAALAKCRTGCRAMALASGMGRDPLMAEPIPLVSSISDADFTA